MRKRRNPGAGFQARVALEAVKGERTVSELAAGYGVHPTMVHQWSEPWSAMGSRTMASAVLEGAADIVERGSRKPAEVDEEKVRFLHTKIKDLAVANEPPQGLRGPAGATVLASMSRKLKPRTGRQGVA